MVTGEIERMLKRQREFEERRRKPPVPKVPEPEELPPVEPLPPEPFERKEGEYLTQVEAEARGWEFTEPLPTGWQLRVVDGRAFQVTPEGWEITERGSIIDPTGRFYTRREYERIVAEQELAVTERPFEAIFPEEDIETMLGGMAIREGATFEEIDVAQEAQDRFIDTLQAEGRTSNTEALLRQLGVSEEEITLFFPEPTIDEAKYWAERYAGMSLPERAFNQFLAGVGDVYITSGGAARWLGYEDVGASLSATGADLQRFAPPSEGKEFEFSDLFSPEFYAEKVVRTVPFALSLAPLAIGGFYAGAAAASAAGLGTLGSWIVGGFAGAALSRPAESALEAGAQYDDAIARGKTEKEASEEADEVFRNNMLLAGADAWEIAIALAPTPKWVPSALVKGGLVRTVRIGTKMVIIGLSEGGEEIYQDLIQRRARGEEWQWDPISKEVFAIGMVMGAGMGLGGDVVQSIVNRSKDAMPPTLKEDFNNLVDDFQGEGFTTEQSELRALDQVAQTPEGQKIVTDAIEEVKKPEVPEIVPEVVPEVEPEVFMTQERWDELSVTSREKAATEVGLSEDVGVLPWADLTSTEQVALGAEVVKEPERVVYTEGGVPASPREPVSQEMADNIPLMKDIGVKERWVRPTRKVFERMGLYETYKGIQKAEVELGEAKATFNRKLGETSKLVDKERRYLVFRELENPGSQVGLTFNEKRAVTWFRENFNKWADKLNLPEEKRIKNYITHIFEADIEEQLKEKYPLDPAIARALEYKAPKTIFNPFLQKRLGATTGLVEDPFAAASAYESRELKVLYYEPLLQKIATIANDKTTPPIARDYLRDYARRMTGEPAKLDTAINTTLQEFAGAIEKLPGGKPFARFLTRGNPSGMAAYNFTSVIYTLWLGFKPTSAIRNLSQHTLILGEVGPVHFADAFKLRFTKEGKAALADSLVLRSRRAAFVPGIDDSFADKWVDRFREAALWMFRFADRQNVSDAFLAGYSEAKSLLPEADRQVWIDRGDEVAADTQYLYTKMNSMAISQSSMGRVFSILTTWSENWMELMAKWVGRRPSQVYLQYEKQTGKKAAVASWATTYKAVLMYMAIIGLGYAIKDRERLKAWEYTGITSIRYLADVVGGDFPGLQGPGAVGNLIAGFLTDDEWRLKSGWNQFKGTFTPGIVRQIEGVASGEKDWLTLFFYLEGKDYKLRQLKERWRKETKEYDELVGQERRNLYRKENPLIEAKLFVVGQFTKLSSDEARAEVLRLIEKHELDVELINGYDRVFGVDTNVELGRWKNALGLPEVAVLKPDEEVKYFTTSNFASEVNELVRIMGRTKLEKDGHSLAIEYLRARDQWDAYYDLPEGGRRLYRQQFPELEAQLYLWGRIASFQNPKSAGILLGLMDKYNIPPEAVPAFLDKPERYDELFTRKFELQKKWFDLETEYENYGNPESPVYIEDDEARKEVREKLKDDNPNWMADVRRIEAIDHDASPEIIDSWAERGKVVDDFSAGSSEAKVWLIDHPEVHKWALDQDLLTDAGVDWNEPVLRINVEMAKHREGSAIYNLLKRRKDAYNEGFSEKHIENYVDYYELPIAGYRQERYLLEHPEFAQEMKNIKGTHIPTRVPSEKYDILLEKEVKTPEDEYKMDAYKIYFPEELIDTYVDWYITKRSGYHDDWFLQDNRKFYEAMIEHGVLQRRNFINVPSKEVALLLAIYKGIIGRQAKLDYRAQNPDVEWWLVTREGYTPIADRGDAGADISREEKLAREIAEGLERIQRLGE